jgi:cupin 2 domain-containing protein
MNQPQNLFNNLPSLHNGEDFTSLLNCQNVVIERIVSSSKPDTKIYNQIQDEWVILIQGMAQLKINDDVISLKAGDYLFIPSKTPHQVIKTSATCIWLAVHIY